MKIRLALLPLLCAVSLASVAQNQLVPGCAARACLESPYGPGMRPACARHIEALQRAIVRGEGLPRCEKEIRARDFSSGWYWKAMGWERCSADDEIDNPYTCGDYESETLPDLVHFEPGTAQLTSEGELTLADLVGKLATLTPPSAGTVRIVAVAESRRDYASEALAYRRAETVAAALAGHTLRRETEAQNWVIDRPLIHGAWVSAIGRGLSADRTVLGRSAPPESDCGLVEIEKGSLRAAVDQALRRCGYRLRGWLMADGDTIDYVETQNHTRRVGRLIEDVLTYLQTDYGLTGTLDDYEVDFYAVD